MRQLILVLLFAVFTAQSGAGAVITAQPPDTVYKSETLVILRLGAHTFQHVSYLSTNDFGKVSCNGMIVAGEGEAVVFDTPADPESSSELLDYLAGQMKISVKAVVVTHFHADCVAGLAEFHKRGVVSYATNRTIDLLRKNGDEVLPRKGFNRRLELAAGDRQLFAEYFGQGHTRDNIVGWYPDGRILFGGCLIKELEAGKGNLADANTTAWSETVAKIKQRYGDAEIVIPGHGKTGGTELLDYTYTLFNETH